MKVGYKLTSALLIFTALTTGLFYYISLLNQKRSSSEAARGALNSVRELFITIQERDTKLLFSTLQVIVRDSSLRKVYLEKNREKLYKYKEQLFRELNSLYGITHFYFILPDGRVFLRLHDKDLHGDLVNRLSLKKARDTKKPASEIELGKTAFALRAVMPYYDGDELIGYVELAEGVDHFLEILKQRSNSEFAIIADKELLDRNEWQAMRHHAGLRDNWEDLIGHTIVGSTGGGEKVSGCFNEHTLELVEKGKNIFQQIRIDKHDFMCGGFVLDDAEGRHIGAVLSLMDISGPVQIAKESRKTILQAAIFLFIVTFTAGMILSRSMVKPISKLKYAAEQIGKGNLEVDIKVSSKDEIRDLADSVGKMARDLRQRETELRAAYSDMENFSVAVSHDLKAPVRRIEGFAGVLLKEYKDRLDDEGKDILKRVCDNTGNMARLIDDLLQFSRASSAEIRRTDIDMEQLTREVHDELRSASGDRNLHFQMLSMPPAYGDPALIRQVMFNLLSNAYKFTRQKEAAFITVAGHAEENENIYYVKDNGIGFDMQFANKLFGLFQRIQVDKRFEGTGVGLVIVRKIIEKHGGRVWALGRPGEGAEFFFSLPGNI